MKRNKHLPTPIEGVYDVPFVAINHVRSVVGGRALLAVTLEVGDGYLCIEWQLGIQQVILCAVKKSQFTAFFSKTQDDLSAVVADLKSKAYDHGATLEAIQLLGALTPLTKEEEYEMAKAPVAKENAKLSKAVAAKGVAKDPKAAVAAMAAARAARNSANDAKKIKVVNKVHGAREGSKRGAMLDIVLASKTVAEAKENGAGWIDVKFAETSGFISLS